ncbi:MAG: hypothetical protein ACE37F_06985 [Nannocystaceae bacterium]|nr:hypothetical protein [bacterium]
MRLRIVTVVVSVAAGMGVPRTGRASTQAERAPVQTLPNSARYGPPRRGQWRIDANVPQSPGAWDPPRAAAPPAPVPQTPYRRYLAHPYADEGRGFVLRGMARADERPPGRLHSGRLSAEIGQSGPEQARASVALRVALWRVGFDSTLDSHFTGRGTQDRPVRNTLVVGNTNGLVAPVLHPRVTWWVGAGINYAGLPRGVRVGPNLTSSVDLFVRRPLVMSARGDLGTVGGAMTMAGRGSIGFMLGSFELQVGYEARRLDDLLLQGPMVGARAWF